MGEIQDTTDSEDIKEKDKPMVVSMNKEELQDSIDSKNIQTEEEIEQDSGNEEQNDVNEKVNVSDSAIEEHEDRVLKIAIDYGNIQTEGKTVAECKPFIENNNVSGSVNEEENDG